MKCPVILLSIKILIIIIIIIIIIKNNYYSEGCRFNSSWKSECCHLQHINKVSLYLFISFMLLWLIYIVADLFFLIINEHFICYLGLAASTSEWTEIFTISL